MFGKLVTRSGPKFTLTMLPGVLPGARLVAVASALALGLAFNAATPLPAFAVECNAGANLTDEGDDHGDASNTACGDDADAFQNLQGSSPDNERNSAFGSDAKAGDDQLIADGVRSGQHNTAVGSRAEAGFIPGGPALFLLGGDGNSAFGEAANAGTTASDFVGGKDHNTAVGAHASAQHGAATALGYRAEALSNGAIAIGGDVTGSGTGASATGRRSIAIGVDGIDGGTVGATVTTDDSVAIGTDSSVTGGTKSTAVGYLNVITAADSTAVGTSNTVSSAGSSAFGGGNFLGTATDDSVALGSDLIINDGSSAAVAIGIGAEIGTAGGATTAENGIAIGEGANLGQLGSDAPHSIAIGTFATAGADRSAAFGAGAVASLPNQQVFGTIDETYAMRGITSPLSKLRQSGPLEVVTTDAAGNLASDGGETFNRIDENEEGVAIAMALSDPDLFGGQTFAIKANGGYFEGSYAVGVTVKGLLVDDVFGGGEKLTVSGGAGYGVQEETVGGRVSMQLGW